MRKLFAAALAICLVFAFAMPAAAADVKVSGTFHVQGFYFDKQNVQKDIGASYGRYSQRFRVGAEFVPEEGVGVYVRTDATDNDSWDAQANHTKTFNFDLAYGYMTTGIGKFTIGRQWGGLWGTTFNNGGHYSDRILYEAKFGPLGIVGQIEKQAENDWTDAAESDKDKDFYAAGAVYFWEGGEAGALLSYTRDATNSASSYKQKFYTLSPYLKATFGPVYVEAELTKSSGDDQVYEDSNTTATVDKTGLAYYGSAKINLGPAYVGAFYMFMQGDDPNTATENEHGYAGDDLDVGYLMFSDEDWSPVITSYGAGLGEAVGASGNGSDDGGKFYGITAGVSPTEQLSITAAIVTGVADEKDTYAEDDFGVEFDLGASYKLFSSVTYNVKFAYLWTGDYWKGTSSTNEVDDIYMLYHMIEWAF